MVKKSNITLIGMPASGKSSVGVVLAKRLGMNFVDVDIVIQEKYGMKLKEIIEKYGDDGFRKIEDEVNASINVQNSIISPGGSVIYGEKAMKHLGKISNIIYLELSYNAIKSRLGDLTERGVSLKKGQTLRSLYNERVPIYEKYAHITVNEMKKSIVMEREFWRGGNMLYPVPAVMVSLADKSGKANIITIAWTGTICSDPAMVYISVRPSRYSYNILKETGEFVINICTENLVSQTDTAGVKSGSKIDKFKELGLTKGKSKEVAAPYIQECPIALECKVSDIIPLGTHDMFLAKVLAVNVDKKYIDEKGKFDLKAANPIVYSHGEYYGLGKLLGTFGYSVRKNKV